MTSFQEIKFALSGLDTLGATVANKLGCPEKYDQGKKILGAGIISAGILLGAYGCMDADTAPLPQENGGNCTTASKYHNTPKPNDNNLTINQNRTGISVEINLGGLKLNLGGNRSNEETDHSTPGYTDTCPDLQGGLSLDIPNEVQEALNNLGGGKGSAEARGILQNAIIAYNDFPVKQPGQLIISEERGQNPIYMKFGNRIDQSQSISDCTLQRIRKAVHEY